jgi:hypothetical protein
MTTTTIAAVGRTSTSNPFRADVPTPSSKEFQNVIPNSMDHLLTSGDKAFSFIFDPSTDPPELTSGKSDTTASPLFRFEAKKETNSSYQNNRDANQISGLGRLF